MVVAAIEAKFYRSFISGLGLTSDPVFADFQQWDQEKWPQQKAAVADKFAAESRAHWTEVFSDLDACVSPVLTYAESAEQAHLAERAANRRIGDQVFPAPAPRFLQAPSSAARSELTDDPAAYLRSIGVSEASLDAWRQSLPG